MLFVKQNVIPTGGCYFKYVTFFNIILNNLPLTKIHEYIFSIFAYIQFHPTREIQETLNLSTILKFYFNMCILFYSINYDVMKFTMLRCCPVYKNMYKVKCNQIRLRKHVSAEEEK